MTNEELQSNILDWASKKHLLSPDNSFQQFAKFISEAGELGDSMLAKNRAEIADAIGDVQVTLIILCDQLDLNYNDCLELAWNVIKNRTGKTIDGTFIKDK